MGFLTMKLWEGVANAFRLFFSEFLLFCQKVDFFYPLNRNDDLKESESDLMPSDSETLVPPAVLHISAIGIIVYHLPFRG